MAKEIQEAEGQKIGYLLVNDDVAVKDSTWTVGRRGVAGNFFVIKAVGAKADQGGSLEECVAVGEKVIANVRTMGIALSLVHAAGARHAAVRDRRRRDRDRDRHPRRAGPPARQDRAGRRARRHPARRDRARPAVQLGRRGRADGERPGRHADQRALPPVRLRPQEARRPRASTSGAATSTSTAPRSRWPAPTSRCSRSTTSSRSSSWLRPRSPIASSRPIRSSRTDHVSRGGWPVTAARLSHAYAGRPSITIASAIATTAPVRTATAARASRERMRATAAATTAAAAAPPNPRPPPQRRVRAWGTRFRPAARRPSPRRGR